MGNWTQGDPGALLLKERRGVQGPFCTGRGGGGSDLGHSALGLVGTNGCSAWVVGTFCFCDFTKGDGDAGAMLHMHKRGGEGPGAFCARGGLF